jgi:hypothetical protein
MLMLSYSTDVVRALFYVRLNVTYLLGNSSLPSILSRIRTLWEQSKRGD